MKPVVIGLIVAVAVVGAFLLGSTLLEPEQGPAEKLGEQIDEAVGN